MIVGLGGKCCAGKDTLAAILKESGYAEISVDALGHRALETRRDEVVAHFGPEILATGGNDSPDGETFPGGGSPEEPPIDRKALGRIVFSSSKERRALEAIVHPEMKRLLAEEIEARRGNMRARGAAGAPGGDDPRIIINAALIFYMELDTLCDAVLWITASPLRRFLRAWKRDDLPLGAILRRFWAQRQLGPHPSGENVDIHIVKNEGGRERLIGRLQSIGLLER